MSDFTVIRIGTDSSGRGIFMTRYMHTVWKDILADRRVAPFAAKVTIVQGAFMELNGGGAKDSVGYHDKGGCVDIRTWNLTKSELDTFIRVARQYGWAFWRRDRTHGGMAPHAHGVLGTDRPLTDGAARQWQQYIAGQDGLADHAPDYEWRPSPLVLTPPKDWLEMASLEDVKQAVRDVLNEDLIDTPPNDPKFDAVHPRVSLLEAVRRMWQVDRATNLHTAAIEKKVK